MRFIRCWIGLPLAAILAVGCATKREDQVVLTEVAVPALQPVGVSSPLVDTNAPLPKIPPIITNQPPTVVVPQIANPPPPPQMTAPSNAWIVLESWCQANGLNAPRKVAPEKWEVSAPDGKILFQSGSQIAPWNGVSVWLGFAPRYLRGKLHIHWLDVQKTLEPLLRPITLPCRPNRVIVIDPGHGGVDGGTVSARQQVEKNLTLDWGLRLKTLLETNGWKVYLTRTNDSDINLAERIAVADQWKANLFISLHFNGLGTDTRHAGIETFCTTPVGMPSSVKRNNEDAVSQQYPNNAYDADNIRLAWRVHQRLVTLTRAADDGVRRARFMTVIRGQRRPAILVEGGFLSNPEEARRLANPEYRERLALAIAQALD
jgi:N-acetylmuramoyl-L-alanine amidase